MALIKDLIYIPSYNIYILRYNIFTIRYSSQFTLDSSHFNFSMYFGCKSQVSITLFDLEHSSTSRNIVTIGRWSLISSTNK